MSLIDTRSEFMALTNSADSTTAGTTIANPADVYLPPSGDGVINMGAGGSLTANGIKFTPFGAGVATNTFLMAVFAWEHVKSKAGSKEQWHADLLAAFTCTLCTLTGLAGCDVDASHLYCDTITETSGNPNVSNEVVSPTGNVSAHILVDSKAPRLIQVLFALNNSATGANSLFRKL